jgi:hypothetical protein
MKINIFKKQILSLLLLSALFLPVIASAQTISASSTGDIDRMSNAFRSAAGYNPNTTVTNVTAQIIRVVLSLLGILFTVLIIVSGYQWMTAGGNDDAVKKAKSRMSNAIIGLVIVLAAYIITAFIFNNLSFFKETGTGAV